MAELGRVKWFNSSRNYGVITRDEGGPDLFFNGSSVLGRGPLVERQRVRFIAIEGRKGVAEAREVEPV